MESVFRYHELKISNFQLGDLASFGHRLVEERGGKLEVYISYISLKSTLVTCNTEMQQIGAEQNVRS